MSSVLFNAAPSIITRTKKSSSSIFSLHSSANPLKRLPFQSDGLISQQNHVLAPPIRVSSASPSIITDKKLGSSWEEFCENVSGEWDGFGADFTARGEPVELPESVTPEAYREWEVKVFDWQTQCPTLAQSSPVAPNENERDPSSFSFFYKTIRLLPTVGCEADAATTYSVDERNLSTANPNLHAFAYRSNGSYVALWQSSASTTSTALELEHCLVQPASGDDADNKSRARVIQVLQLQENDDGNRLKLSGIKVFLEQWYGPFRNGDQLGGCAIRDTAFASTEPVEASRVRGSWSGSHLVASFPTMGLLSPNGTIQELGGQCERETTREDLHLVLLPKNLWCSVKETEDGEILCEAGWLLDDGGAVTSKCTFSGQAELQEMAMASESLNH